jgi:hypothetical protein
MKEFIRIFVFISVLSLMLLNQYLFILLLFILFVSLINPRKKIVSRFINKITETIYSYVFK